jgi:hypothetical protein
LFYGFFWREAEYFSRFIHPRKIMRGILRESLKPLKKLPKDFLVSGQSLDFQ